MYKRQDADGDGIGELVIGTYENTTTACPLFGPPVVGPGMVRIHAAGSGALLAQLSGVGGAGDRYGTAVAGAGDLDGDGCAEILVGANDCAPDDGYLQIVSLFCDKLPALALGLAQPGGPTSLKIVNLGGQPGDLYFTALTLDPANEGAGFGTGFWGGLHISLPELQAQLGSAAPPFVGLLDAQGESGFYLTPGTLSLIHI